VIEVQRDWAPQGADRFFNWSERLLQRRSLLRVIKGFMVQWESTVRARLMQSGATQHPRRSGQAVEQAWLHHLCNCGQHADSRSSSTMRTPPTDGMGFAPFARWRAAWTSWRPVRGRWGRAPRAGAQPGHDADRGHAYWHVISPSWTTSLKQHRALVRLPEVAKWLGFPCGQAK